MRLQWGVLLLMGLVGCSSAPRVVRLDTGRGEPLVFTLRTTDAQTVELGEDDFEGAESDLAHDVRPPTHPQEAARRLFEVDSRTGTYLYETRSRRLTLLGPGEHLDGELPASGVALTSDYLRWCERTGRPGDCLGLLVESRTVNGDGCYALALALARGVVLEEMMDAFKDMADPQAMMTAVLWTWTTYMVLLSLPEPVSKGLAAIMTATLIAYVGVDTFWNLIVGFRRLEEEADRATTFDELREAGERYGKVGGRHAARAFAMLATAAVGSTASGLAGKVPTLPGAAQAAQVAALQGGFRLGAVGHVGAVAISAEGAFTIALAPGAVAMSAQGLGGNSSGSRDTGEIEKVMRKLGINTKAPSASRLLEYWNKPVAEYIAKFRKGSIKAELPSDTLKKTLGEALQDGNDAVRKLLLDGRFAK